MPEDHGIVHPLLSTLNKAQCRAVTSTSSTIAILAGPGSGKTHTLASRVVWLIEHIGLRPCDIIVATFTVKAAREMKKRIGCALGNDGREKQLVLGTFHSIARRYIARYGRHINLDSKFGIADDSDVRAIIQRICKREKFTCDPAVAKAWISKEKTKGAQSEHRENKGHKQLVELLQLHRCYDAYQDHLRISNLLDYDDLLVLSVQLLRKYPLCVSNVRAVLIDEYQDTNGIQYELMKLLAQKHSVITVVGDPDQSIYGWRSAEIRNLYRLLRDFPQTEEISLEENYRSSHHILHSALQVIQQDASRYPKLLIPARSRGTKPTLRRLVSQPVEAEWIVSEIKRIVAMTGGVLTHDDVVILLRSASLSRHLESALGKAGINYRMVGGFKFYERFEIKTIIEYLRVIYQPDNNDALVRIINVPKRGIGDATVKALLEEAESNKTTLWSLLLKHCRGSKRTKTVIRKETEAKLNLQVIRLVEGLQEYVARSTIDQAFNLAELIKKLIEKIGFKNYLKDTYSEQHDQRWANVEEFINLAAEFLRDLDKVDDELLPEIEGVKQVEDADPLGRFLASVSLASDVQKDNESCEKGTSPKVTISTIHAAKGLEWPVVFVPAAYNGSIPHSRSDDTDEERRLLFVAMTRAQALLYISCPKQALGDTASEFELSPFLIPIVSLFAKKGPSFDRHILEEIGRIIDRPVPSEKQILEKLAHRTIIDDDIFPIDPGQLKQNCLKSDSYSENFVCGASQYQVKRQKRSHEAGSTSSNNLQWQTMATTKYATTMEQGFTMTEFTTAGAHHMALEAAELFNQKEFQPHQGNPPLLTKQTKSKKGAKSIRPTKPPNQPSLFGFFKKENSNCSTEKPELLHSTGHPFVTSNIECSRTERVAIDPELAEHNLGHAPWRPITPVARNRAIKSSVSSISQSDFTSGQISNKSHYGGCFSSSPSRDDRIDFATNTHSQGQHDNTGNTKNTTATHNKENTQYTNLLSLEDSCLTNSKKNLTFQVGYKRTPNMSVSAPGISTRIAAAKATQRVDDNIQKPVGLHGGRTRGNLVSGSVGVRRPNGFYPASGTRLRGNAGELNTLERLKRPFKCPIMDNTINRSSSSTNATDSTVCTMIAQSTTMEKLRQYQKG